MFCIAVETVLFLFQQSSVKTKVQLFSASCSSTHGTDKSSEAALDFSQPREEFGLSKKHVF